MEPVQLKKPQITGTGLKRLACVSMFLDHIGASCLEAGVLQSPALLGPDYKWFSTVYALDQTLRLIGRLAFPIYCFLLVEGFLHTHDVRRYGLRLFAFALLSEFPFDWAFFRQPFYPGYQNVYWTLLLGLAAMAAMHRAENGRLSGALLQVLGAGLCAAAAELLRTDYGATGVLLIVVLYDLRGSRAKQCIAGACLTAYELTGPLAFLPIWAYNGQRGHCPQWQAQFYYFFYPAHLLALACVTNLLLH